MNTFLRLFRAIIDQETPRTRAETLLRTHLSQTQFAQLETCGCFEVIGGDSGHIFRISRTQVMNVEEFDSTGNSKYLWCFGPKGRLPLPDVLLAQKMALELFENEARAVANIYPSRYYGGHPRARTLASTAM